MAPPTPVFTNKDIRSRYQEQLQNPEKYNCQLKSLTQYECTFKVLADGKRPQEIICLPFKRLFQRCLIPTRQKENGKKVIKDKWINIEITSPQTNQDLIDNEEKYGKDVQDFLNAEKELKKLFEMELGDRM